MAARLGSALAGSLVLAAVAVRLTTSTIDDPTEVPGPALYVVVGLLLLVRHPADEEVPPSRVTSTLPSLLLSAVVLLAAPPGDRWPVPAVVGFGAGVAGAAISLAFLGRSFGMVPARRPLVVKGPYRWVRHPAYLAELVALASAAVATVVAGPPEAAGVAVVATVLIVPATQRRIAEEELVLAADPTWVEYVHRTPDRLVPLPRRSAATATVASTDHAR